MAVVDSQFQTQAVLVHLDELEMDHIDKGNEESDEEFEIEEAEEVLHKHLSDHNPGRKRTTRSMVEQRHGAKTFSSLLQELDSLAEKTPSYLTAVVQPPKHSTPKKICSVCGYLSTYRCTRCGARFCCQKCYSIHTDTRCLKFMA